MKRSWIENLNDFSAFLSGPACSLHGLWGLPLFQLHPQPHFVHNSFNALSKGFLRHVWKVLDLPGEILEKSGLESILQKFAKAVSRRSEEEETSLDQDQELILVIGRTG